MELIYADIPQSLLVRVTCLMYIQPCCKFRISESNKKVKKCNEKLTIDNYN